MRRRVASVLSVLAAVPVFVALPVMSDLHPRIHPVRPHLSAIAVAPRPSVTGVLADTGPRRTARFDLVGASWQRGRLPAGDLVQVRTRHAGNWSSWSSLGMPDGGPDGGSADAHSAARHATATDPLWVGDADGVQARVVDTTGHPAAVPPGLHIVLVDGGSSAADAAPGPARPLGGDVASAAQGQPTIYTRAQWGADESLRRRACPSGPDFSPTITMGFIHHTDGSNSYTASQVPSIIRSIYAYHVESNGWCDIGYNFLVDRFGRIWEGRYGGITKPVIGAHTGGYNYDTFAASLIGNFGTARPPGAMLAAVEKLFAWKLGSYYLDPTGKTTYVAGSFSGSRYRAGTDVTFNVISGHRNADYTSCPGDAAYADLPAIRKAVLADMGAGLVAPIVTPRTAQMASGTAIRIQARVLAAQSWTATVTNAQGVTVDTLTGTADPSLPISQVWNLTDTTGLPVPPGTYTVTLTSQRSDGVAALPFATTVTVTPPVTISALPLAAYGSTVALGGTAVPGASVAIQRTDVAAGAAQPVETVVASAAGTWSTTFVADRDWSWNATVDGYTTPTGTTKVAPVVTAPVVSAGRVLIRAGDTIQPVGTALPGTNVALVSRTSGISPSSATADLPVGSDGTWRDPSSVQPTAPTTFSAQDGRGLTAPTFTVYPVGTTTASAPSSGWAGRTVTVSGNAGQAPAPVHLSVKGPGDSSYHPVRTTTARADGTFAVALPLPALTTPGTVWWQVGTDYAPAVSGSLTVEPTFAPTATGPSRVAYGVWRAVSGTAVPGDVVTVWSRPVGGRTWSRTASTTAAPDTAWSVTVRWRRDSVWRVTSPSGTTANRTTVVVPTIAAPARAASGTLVHLRGLTPPGRSLALYRELVGSSTWARLRGPVVSRTGAWSTWRRVTRSLRFKVVSSGHASRVVTVGVG